MYRRLRRYELLIPVRRARLYPVEPEPRGVRVGRWQARDVEHMIQEDPSARTGPVLLGLVACAWPVVLFR